MVDNSVLYGLLLLALILWLVYEKLSNYNRPTPTGNYIHRDIESYPDYKDYAIGSRSLPPLTDVNSTIGSASINLNAGDSQASDKISKGEQFCRIIVDELYRDSTVRYNVRGLKGLNNDITAKSLELDILIVEEKIAIEYQGEQHYKATHFNPTENDDILMTDPNVNSQQYRDQQKKMWCHANRIRLVIVPYTCDTYTSIKNCILAQVND